MCPALLFFSPLLFSWAPWFSPPDFPPLAPDALKAAAGATRRRQDKLWAQLSLALVSAGLLGFCRILPMIWLKMQRYLVFSDCFGLLGKPRESEPSPG